MENKKAYSGITEGVIWKELLKYFFPIFLGTLLQQSYHTVDAIIIGQFAGKGALASIDATGGFIKLLINVSVGISSGAAVVIAQLYGGKNEKELTKAVHTTLLFMLICGMAVTVVGVVCAPGICTIMNVPEEIFDQARIYAQIYFSGSVFMLLYNAAAGIFRAVGDSKRPFYFLTVSCIANILLDIIFVAVLRKGVAGAALATVISQLLSSFLVLRALMRTKESYGYRIEKTKIHRKVLKQILVVGIPIGMQSAMYSISNIFMQSGINAYGTDAVAGWAVCGKLDFLLWTVVETLGIAATTFVAQNYGAKKRDRVFQSIRASLGLSAVLIIVLSCILYFTTGILGYLFVSDTAAVQMAVDMMHWIAPFYITCIGGEILSSIIRGTGDSFLPMLLTMAGTCGMRILWIMTVSRWSPGIRTVIMGYPFTWIVTTVLFIIYYFIVRRRWKDQIHE